MSKTLTKEKTAKTHILIKGARVNNLKNIDVAITRNKFTVITGVSGSGKSSLAFDTLFAEGQRRYVESLSAYARQFLGKLEKPAVDYIHGIAPAIAIEQKVNTVNKRSTVGTSTEIYDYLKLLYARIGKTFSPVSGKEVKKHTLKDVVNFITQQAEGEKIILLSKIEFKDKTLSSLLQRGFSRIWLNNEMLRIDKTQDIKIDINNTYLIIDRFVASADDEEQLSRIYDSVETAFFEGKHECQVLTYKNEQPVITHFSNKFEMDGINFEEPSVHFFSFNNPFGACKKCEGYGSIIGIDENLVIPDGSLSVYQDAVVCWKGEKMQQWKEHFILNATKEKFPIHKSYDELTPEQKDVLWKGSPYFEGINDFFKMVESNSYKIQYRVLLARYRGKTTCPDCKGTRLRKDANYVKINKTAIAELVLMPIDKLSNFFKKLKLSESDTTISKRLLIEINNRLSYLENVGLGYLTLNRLSSTLSGGESQRINLATSLGSSLVGSMYILDEPSIGLHSKDTEQLIGVLKQLQQLGNSVILVEHDEDIMRAADEIIDIGPEAGTLGGNVVFSGNFNELLKKDNTLTANYLNKTLEIPVPEKRRKWKNKIVVEGAKENNLKNITTTFPLGVITAVTGVSGSGKSTLIKNCLLPQLSRYLNGYSDKNTKIKGISGDVNLINAVEYVNQNPIGKSSRSNPVTYIKAYDEIRNLFANHSLSKNRGYKPAHFSFNVDGGRCETCKGEGEITVEMQFMADIHLKCNECKGKRFKQELLDIKIGDKHISNILDLTIDEGIAFFEQLPKDQGKKIAEKLSPLQEVGLGYVHLGQSSNTLSGGEAQRVKLAGFLSKKNSKEKLLFIFDEPTTGLHFHDINKLIKSFNGLITQGHTIIVIEHNLDVVKCADWVIDLGPGGGEHGGQLVFEGTPEDMIKAKTSVTGKYLKEKLAN
ncbi:MAG: excinuclease ABC subunit A [Flavobacteriales bacterium]|nr:excinuclease ABC subunit A [Flavobacteriales bacterium]|tara:strand:+ start:52039 stop:54840 length:2802 start_codon:yes stop_codon:yes gene_type:complete